MEMDLSAGVISDADPSNLAPGQLQDASNMLFDRVVPYKRGGSEHKGTAVASDPLAVAYAEFPGGSEIVAFSTNTNLYKFNGSGWTSAGSTGANTGYLPAQRPVIVPDPANTATYGANPAQAFLRIKVRKA